MARRKQKRQARKRTRPAVLLGKKLGVGRHVALGGGLVAQLQVQEHYRAVTRSWHVAAYGVVVKLRVHGGLEHTVLTLPWRESAELAARDCETALVRLASALRTAGAH
jgi:hypothetical protein